MDFNPLDLLVAAALSDKEPSSESTGSNNKGASSFSQDNNSETSDTKEDADEKPDTMGKTKSNSLKQPITINDLKVANEMSPQKISWSPEAFLSCLDKPSLETEKLIIEQLSPTFMKDIVKCSKVCEKDFNNDIKADEEVSRDVAIKNELNAKVSPKDVKIEDVANIQDNSPCSDTHKANGDESLDVKGNETKADRDVKDNDNKTDSDVSLNAKDDVSLGADDDKTKVVSHLKKEPFTADDSEGKESVPLKDVKLEESCENGSQSDTDTAETSDSKTHVDELPEMSCQELVSLDHPYCLIAGQLLRMPSMDMLDEDVDVCSDSSPLTEDSEQRSRNFSLDCNYLKSGILEGKSICTPQLHQDHPHIGYKHNSNSPHKSPSHSDSTTLRLTKTTDASAFKQVGVMSPERPGPSYGKFKIGTFASFSSSNLELEKYLRGLDSPPNKRLEGDNDRSIKSIHSPVYSPSVQPLLQSPTLDWDRSEAGSEVHDDSSDARTPHRLSPDFTTERVGEWSHPMYHDHDYCVKAQQKPVLDDIVKLPLTKRKYTKRKNKLDPINHEKIMKAKYLKKELLKDSFPRSAPSPLPPESPVSSANDVNKTNPVGRPRKRTLEKSVEEEIDPETGAKMKITGKFQDQYVYYLSKSKTTSRRRQTPTLPLHSDKIIVPAPKPGDIIIPHLTDADIEVVKTKGRSALNIPDRPHMPCISSSVYVPPKSSASSSLPISQSNEPFSDVDSHIVSTILSMENDNLASPSSSHSQDLSQHSDIYNGQSSITNDPNITSEEQVLNYLLSVVKEETSLLQSSSSLFSPLPSDPLYSKPGHLTDSELGTHNHKMDSVHSDILSSHPPLENHVFDNSIIKSEVDDGGGLPDDLSSLISHSQVTTLSSQDLIDSQSSAKSHLSSDLNSLGTPGLAPPALRLTSIEKTLDYLGVKDGEIKLDNGPKILSTDLSSHLAVPNSTIAADDDTPWIVTVTLYFNDVPAIMIANEPCIRLVDIHKQILPAKDTGILKKRCQLLNIPVLNCTEMHRYFLVQYGKAYNSKSTLIISKDQATELVKYYATPQPRVGRDEANLRRNSCGVSSDGSNMSPVSTEAVSLPTKKRGYTSKSSKKGATHSRVPSPGIGVPQNLKTVGLVPNQASDVFNKRTRHKKINYLEMLKGEEKEKEKSSDDSILQTIESVLKSSSDHTTVHNPKSTKEKYSVNSKSRSKKNKLGKGHALEKKNKEKTSHRRKSVESKKVKVSGKNVKSSKTKGSTPASKLSKKLEKLAKKKIEPCLDIDPECVEEHLNRSNKFKPLKLKVNSLLNFSSQRRQSSTPSSASSTSFPSKKGLFSRSNSTSSAPAEQRHMRVLAVAHQAALSFKEGDSHLPSQPADIHLDLFTRSTSACVRCHTCSQFLSVPHFMKHHHVPMDNEWLATEAAHRILVPRNKENISEEERRLWEEFHTLQEAIGGFGEADDDSDSGGDSDAESDFEGNEDQSALETSGASSYLSMDTSHNCNVDISYESQMSSCQSSPHISRAVSSGDNGRNSQNNVKAISNDVSAATSSHPIIVNSSHIAGNGPKLVLKNQQQLGSSLPTSLPNNSIALNDSHDSISSSSVRTSSRRRKSKQLFSIENYCTTPTKKGADEEAASHQSLVS